MNDKYALKARVYPMIIFFLPAALLAITYSLKFESYVQLFSSISVVGALSFLFSQIGRDAGKKKEKKMWEDWGGSPSCQVMRFRDKNFDRLTKSRYHTKLAILCPPDVLVTSQYEQHDPDGADEVYKSWTKFLISKSRDTTKFPILFKENVNYGFRRNMWGLKPYSIVLIILLMAICFSYYYYMNKTFDIRIYPFEFFITQTLLLSTLAFWIFKVKTDWVKPVAYSYAERLLEVVEEI